MPRFYLHVHNGTGFARDEEGADVPDLTGARARAIEGIRSIISDEARRGMVDLTGRIEIVTEAGEVAAVVPFAQGFELRLPESDPG